LLPLGFLVLKELISISEPVALILMGAILIKLANIGRNKINVPLGEWEKIPRL
jgi:hypothetical protein